MIKESDIARSIRKFLKLNGILCWPVRESLWQTPGLADICGVLPAHGTARDHYPPGRHFEFEVKNPGYHKKGSDQIKHLAEVKRAGGIGAFVFSVRDVEVILIDIGVPLRATRV